MTTTRSGGSRRALWPAAVTLLIIVATLVTAMEAFGPIREVKTWTLLGVVCVVEMLFGVVSTAFMARDGDRGRSSSATLAILGGIVVGYAVTLIGALLLILVVTALFSHSGERLMVAVIVALSACWLAAAVAMYSNDLRMADAAAPALQMREIHARCAKQIRAALAFMRTCVVSDHDSRRMLDVLGKQMSAIDAALSHSNGGHGGVHNAKGNELDGKANDAIQRDAARVAELAATLPTSAPDKVRETLSAISACAQGLAANIATLELE